MKSKAIALSLWCCIFAGTAQAQQSVMDDYPPQALRDGREGTTEFRLLISTLGGVDDCIITASSGHDDLDEATCNRLKRRARFTPAKDAQGTPIPDTYSGHFTWRIAR